MFLGVESALGEAAGGGEADDGGDVLGAGTKSCFLFGSEQHGLQRCPRTDIALGHLDLFDMLAEHWTADLSIGAIEEAIASRRDAERLRRARLGYVVHPDPVHHPRPTTFGPGYWGAFVRGGGEGGPWRVRMKLFDGIGFVRAEARIVSRRLYADIASTPGVPPAARADRVGGAAARAVDPDAAKGDGRVSVALARAPSFRLMADRRELERVGTCRHWTALVALRLEPHGPGRAFMDTHGVARAQLPDLPGLRVMGTNLGVRTACGWALWETATLDEVVRLSGTIPAPDAAHASRVIEPGAGRAHWRRIGSDDAPVSFARLLAEGVIGYEDSGDRPPTWVEQALVGKVLRRLGAPAVTGSSVWRLAQDAIEAMRVGLRQHADLARVAHCLSNPAPEGASGVAAMSAWWRGAAQHRAGTLGWLWADLAQALVEDASPEGPPARWWSRLGRPAFSVPTTGQLEEAWRVLREQPHAHRALVERWETDDVGLREALRLVSLLVLGGALSPELARTADGGRRGSLSRFLERAPETPVLAGVGGGRSLRRVGLLDDVRRLRLGYATRSRPDGTRASLSERFGSTLKEKRRHLVDDISKQVASAIVLTALRQGAHVVVAEDLSDLGASGGQDPDTNRRLRAWRRGRVTAHLEELCELHGLVLASTSPAFSSWRDARDNTMGIRAEPVSAAQLRAKGSPGRTRLDAEIAEARSIGDDAGERARTLAAALVDLSGHLEKVVDVARDAYVVVPRRGGRWFAPKDVRLGMVVSTDEVYGDRVPPGLRDADSNAAGNTAIRWIWGRVLYR